MLVTENVTPLREKLHGFGRSFIRYNFQSKWRQNLTLSRSTYGVSEEARNIEGSLWVDAMMADYVPHTRNNQNQAIRACFQEIVNVLCKLGVKKLCGSLVDIASFDLFVARVYKWSNLRVTSVNRALDEIDCTNQKNHAWFLQP